ncbi:MAG: hypothetical protein EON55_25180, partial [Alphaproteobacteria bacterium]
PLHIACANGHKACAQVLLTAGANKETVTMDGDTPLHIACANGHEACMHVLLGAGANKEAVNKDGRTPLFVACANGKQACARALLSAGANKEAVNKDGRTSLHIACANGHVACVHVLLGVGANKEAADADDWTPLHIACQNGHETCVRAMLDAGASVIAFASNGATPLSIARSLGHTTIVALLKDASVHLPLPSISLASSAKSSVGPATPSPVPATPSPPTGSPSAMNPPSTRRQADASSRSTTTTTTSEPVTRPRRPGWPEVGAAAVAFGVLFLLTRQVLHHIPDDRTVAEGLARYALSALIGLAAFVAAFALRIRDLSAFGVRRVRWTWLLAGVGCGVLAFILSFVVGLVYTALSGHAARNIQTGYPAACWPTLWTGTDPGSQSWAAPSFSPSHTASTRSPPSPLSPGSSPPCCSARPDPCGQECACT